MATTVFQAWLFSQLLASCQQARDSGTLFSGPMDAELQQLFETFVRNSKVTLPDVVSGCPTSAHPTSAERVEAEVDSGHVPSGGETSDDGAGRPTAEQLAVWQQQVVRVDRQRTWKQHTEGLLQCRCFAVEWRSSMLLDKDEFVRRMFGVVGGDASFVLGADIRESRADYFVVVRVGDRVALRDWRKKLMFGHGEHAGEEGLFMRVCVPRLSRTDKGINAFVQDMLRKCDGYSETCRYKEAQLIREQSRSGGGGKGKTTC
jgi:hypothetical protein